MSSRKQKPFGEAACEADLATLKDRYSSYFLDTTPFNDLALRPEVYLLIGRRGAGKTALTQYFGFQGVVPDAISIDVNEPQVFAVLLQRFDWKSNVTREAAIPAMRSLWELILWYVVFKALQGRDERIKRAIYFDIIEHSGLVSFVRSVLKAVVRRASGDDGDRIAKDLEELFSDPKVQVAKDAVFDLCRKHTVIVAVDTLEQYNLEDERMMWANAALIEAASQWNLAYVEQNLHIKLFQSGEAYPHLYERIVLNPLKSVRDPIYLNWPAKDLLRLICWRYFCYLREAGLLDGMKEMDVDWNNYHDTLQKVWRPYFGESITNRCAQEEDSFAYVLRHTQMRPRQLIVLCNAIAARAERAKTFPKASKKDIVAAIYETEAHLAGEVLNSYSAIYPHVDRIVDALTGMPKIFRGNELDRIANRSRSAWPKDSYSLDGFRGMVTELGIVGRVRSKSQDGSFVRADFAYNALSSRVVVTETDECVIHPMFYERLKCERSLKCRVMPFPDGYEYVFPSVP